MTWVEMSYAMQNQAVFLDRREGRSNRFLRLLHGEKASGDRMNPFKTLWRWACRWWTGREFWEPTGPRPGEPLSEWLKKFRRDGKLVHMKCVNEPAAQLIELVKSPPDVMERTQDLAGRQLAALAPLFRHPTPEVAAQQPASASDFIDSSMPWTISARVNDGSGWRTISKTVNSGESVAIEFANSAGTAFGLNPETGELDPIAHNSTQNGVTKIELVEGPALEAEKEAHAAAWQEALANVIGMRRGGNVIVEEGDTIKAVDCGTKPSDGRAEYLANLRKRKTVGDFAGVPIADVYEAFGFVMPENTEATDKLP